MPETWIYYFETKISGHFAGILIHLHDAQWQADEDFPVAADIDGENADGRKPEALEIQDDVPSEEWHIWWHLDFEFRLDRHIFRIEGFTVLVDDVDGKLVAADVLRGETEPQRECAGRMHDRKRAGGERVEGAGNDELAVVVCGEVTEGGDLDVHCFVLV